MKRQRKASGTLYQETLPLYFRGDYQFLNYVQLRFESTINLQKPHIVSLPLKLFNNQKVDFIQPLAQIQTFDDNSKQTLITKQSIIKTKSQIKEGVFYVYFPSNVRVDQKIYKIYQKSYQSFIKDVPKAFKGNFAKFIIWQNGSGQQSLQSQKNKLQQLLSNTIKNVIQKKIQNFTAEINAIQLTQFTPKILQNLFVARNKLSSIYKQLKLAQNASQHLTNLYTDILNNYKKFIGTATLKQQKILNKSPFIVKSINTVFSHFQNKQNYLQIINFCFLKVFQVNLDLFQQVQGMKKFKQFIDFILNNIFNSVLSRQEEIAKNIWIVQTIDQGLRILRNRNLPTILNPQKLQQYSLLNVKICSQYRNAIQSIGVIFYGLNTYCVFPRNLQYQLKLCIKCMHNQPLTYQQYPELKTVNRLQQINKLLFLSGQPINQTIQLIMNNFQSFKLIYIRTLQLLQKTLSESPYKKVSWSMKLSVLKSSIIYFGLKDEKRMSLESLLEEDKVFSYETKKSVWQKLQIINKVYRLTLSKRYNIKMSVQDLLNIVLDSSIIHLQELWLELVKIISQILFEYKLGQSQQQAEKLNTIDFGQNQDQQDLTKRKRRRTTIHHNKKQIQVGTLKFITLIGDMDEIVEDKPKQKKDKDNSRIRLNIELSNRIISYAVALIEKSKGQQQPSATKKTINKQQSNQANNKDQNGQNSIQPNQQRQEEPIQQKKQQFIQQNNQKLVQKSPSSKLIQLKFVIKTLNGQQKTIPFQILQTEDKFIQVEIKSKQVLLFKIQKLIIDISEHISLVYTMPINHDKIQQYENKKIQQNFQEESFYANISPQLKINTLLLHQPQAIEASPLASNQKYRKPSTSSTTSRPNSQSSYPVNSPYIIYKKLWTPLKFNFTFDKNDQIQIQKIQIQCLDDVYERVFVGEKEICYKNDENISLKIASDEENFKYPFIVFVRPSEKNQLNKQVNQFQLAANVNKRHKESINILPKSLRNRAQSMSKSFMSGNTSNMSIDSNKLSIKFYIKHHQYQYQVRKQISYGKQSPFKVDYRYAQQFQQYTIKNTCNQQLQLHWENQLFELYPYQQIKVFSPLIHICLKYKDNQNLFQQSDCQEEEQINLIKILKLDNQLDLKTMIKKQHLKPEKVSTIELSLQQNPQKQKGTPEVYSLFEPIRIFSEEKGYINVLKWNSNQYQLVGKVEGIIDYITEENKQKALDLMIVPTKKGNISMPEILINSRKGVWKHGKTIRVG